MVKPVRSERRQYPRVDQTLPVNVCANGYDFITVTKNVSCVGAYCRIPKYVPPFTKVQVKLELPMASATESSRVPVECKGVIVRTEDESEGGFNVAIFFNDIKDTTRNKIAHYVNQFLPQPSSA